MTFLQLLYVFFKIGLLGFGGGYAMLSLIQFEVVDHFHWMTVTQFSDMLAISQMTPGPVSINTATYVGYEVAGIPGAVVATIALCLPSILMMYFVMRFMIDNKENRFMQYILTGLRPVLGGLILAAALLLVNRESFVDFGWGERNISVVIFIATFLALYFKKLNAMWLIVAAGAIGVLFM